VRKSGSCLTLFYLATDIFVFIVTATAMYRLYIAVTVTINTNVRGEIQSLDFTQSRLVE